MDYMKTVTATSVKNVGTRISKLEKEIQGLEKQYDKKMENWHKGRRRSCILDVEEPYAMRKMRHEISEKREEILTPRTVTEQIRELPVAELCYSVICYKKCGTEILTSGQMEDGWHKCSVCGKMVYGGAGVKIMEVGKMQYRKRKTNPQGSQYLKRLRKLV